MKKRWVVRELPEETLIKTLSVELNINPSLASLLAQRGIRTFQGAKKFFRPKLDHLHDPFLMQDMSVAVNRLCEAVSNHENILIYGDYDVDGTTSVALVYGFLKKFTDHIQYYIPDRYKEGYGISKKGIEWAAANNINLIITLDCGIKALDKADLAREFGMDMIICDHHTPGEKLPDALAVLDPKREDCKYPFKELSGCGVGFKLLQAFCQQNTVPEKQLFNFLDLVAVSIASDIVPIVGENRVLAHYGLRKLNHSPSPGLKSLIEISGLKGTISISDVVFYLGPRINAAGRLTHAKESVRLLISENEKDLVKFSNHINQTNSDRRDFDTSITDEALEMIAGDEQLTKAKSTVLFKNNWHKGVIGIVASRCTEHYYRPTIILTESNEKATGSARSVDGFDIYSAIQKCSDLLEQFGGHTHAAGLTLSLDNIEAFTKKFEEVVSASISEQHLVPKLEIDLEVPLSFATFKSLSIIQQMGPFGPQNMQPVFLTKGVVIKEDPYIIKDQHVKMQVSQEGDQRMYDCIGFGLADKAENLKPGVPFSIAYNIEENNYMGNRTLQLRLKDLKIN